MPRFPESFDDLTPDECRRVLDGEPLATSYGEELSDTFSMMLDFIHHVYEGGSWQREKVHILRLRAASMARRLNFTPTYPLQGDDS